MPSEILNLAFLPGTNAASQPLQISLLGAHLAPHDPFDEVSLVAHDPAILYRSDADILRWNPLHISNPNAAATTVDVPLAGHERGLLRTLLVEDVGAVKVVVVAKVVWQDKNERL